MRLTFAALILAAAPAAKTRDGELGGGPETDGRRPDAPVERITAAEAAQVRESVVSRLVERELGGQIVAMQREE